MKQLLISITLLLLFDSISLAQQSPFGTGAIMNQVIGDLSNPQANFTSHTGLGYNANFPNPLNFMSTNTNDLYVPAAYDGTESYGLVVYIDSDNDGNIKSEWINVLENDKLIWIAPDNVGNNIDINARMGIAWASLLKMKELFNIDTNRIYMSGQSGGARMAQTLAYLYPEVITGTVPICGASYPIEVSQDYETQNPDSHYEIIYYLSQNDLNYIKTFDRRYAIMTSFDDFREGDIMNIYYNGIESDGLIGKFLEIPGGHCSSSTQHFFNAISFVEHPNVEILKDTFSSAMPQVGGPNYLVNSTVSNGSLFLDSNSNTIDTISYLKTRNGFEWNNRYGSIMEYDINWMAGNKKPINIDIWEFLSDSLYCKNNGVNNTPEKNIRLSFQEENSSVVCLLLASSEIGIVDTLYKGVFSNWDGASPVNVKWQLWDDELRIEFNKNLSTLSTISSEVRLLDDNRAIIVKWENLKNPGEYWANNSWQNGAYFMLSSNSVNNSSVKFDNFSIVGTNNNIFFQPTPPISISIQGDNLTASTGFTNYEWFLNGNQIQNGASNFISSPVEGNYVVIGTMNNLCSNTSSTYLFNSLSMDENSLENDFLVYPNPFSNEIQIEVKSNKFLGDVYKVYSMMGNLVAMGELKVKTSIDLSQLKEGLYFLEINNTRKYLIKN
jgi:hypothetical protein